MGKGKRYHYFVEGECEKKLISVLKEQKDQIVPGKIDVLDVTKERLTELKLRPLPDGVILILIFDTDTQETRILKENLDFLNSYQRIKEVWCIPQVKNLEDELVRATNIHSIKELLDSDGVNKFKADFIKEKRLLQKLCEKNFDLGKMWSSKPGKKYDWVGNDGEKIKMRLK